MTVKLTIDCMGGDHGPSVTVPAAVKFVRAHPDAHLMLVGIESAIRAQLKKLKALDDPALTIVPATEVVAMDDPVEVALRKKKDSSMRVALNRVKEGEAQACISAGNTGALMAVSRYVLKTLPGIERPAIASALPNPTGYTMLLDLGANVDCEPQHLLQFATGQRRFKHIAGIHRAITFTSTHQGMQLVDKQDDFAFVFGNIFQNGF